MSHHIVWGEGAWAEEKEGFICINGLVLQKLEGISRRLESDYLEGFSIWAFGGGSCIIKERQRQINPVGFPVVQDKMEPVQIYFIQRTIWNIVNFRNDTNLGYICKKKNGLFLVRTRTIWMCCCGALAWFFNFRWNELSVTRVSGPPNLPLLLPGVENLLYSDFSSLYFPLHSTLLLLLCVSFEYQGSLTPRPLQHISLWASWEQYAPPLKPPSPSNNAFHQQMMKVVMEEML